MRNLSIKSKMTIWFALVLTAVAAATLAGILEASRMVLRGTVREYLISTVEENVDNIRYVTERSDPLANSYIPFGEGYLQIDMDFMDVVNDVHTALYNADGTMLYGENPLTRQTVDLAFTDSRTFSMTVDNVRYDLYDRRLNIEIPEGEQLWIRGVVPGTRSQEQFRAIARLSLIFLPVILLLAILSGYVLAERLLSRIGRIERTAEQISRGDDLQQRIEVGPSNDEVGRMAKVFNRMLDRLEASFETERRFTSDASHELRTPTAVILAQSEYTLEKPRSTEEYIDALQVIRKQGQRMNLLISDMLDYTRMDQSPQRYPMEELDLSALVRKGAEQMALLKTNGIELTARVDEGVRISGNELLLNRLLQNLVSNAYRYGKENGHIQVTLSRDEEGCVLSVKDDGIGIAPEEQEKIFERFYRSDASRTVQGTGLGLSMVRKIAEMHGGELSLTSAPGEGSCFSVRFAAPEDRAENADLQKF